MKKILPPKACIVCGKMFQPTTWQNITCSSDCKRKRKNATNKAYMYDYLSIKQQAKKAAQEKERKPSTLAEINRSAKALGMSYGKYVLYLESQEKANTARI